MRLMKKEIQTVNTTALNYRFCELMEKGEKLPAHEFSIAEAREILWIEDELHERLIRTVGHDFYPPDRVEEKKPITPAVVSQNPGPKIKFRAVVSSSIGSKAADFTVEAGSKSEADILIAKEIQKLGLKRVTWRIK